MAIFIFLLLMPLTSLFPPPSISLSLLLPSIKGLDGVAKEMEAYCKKQDFSFKSLAIYNTSEIKEKLPALLSQGDVVMTLLDPVTMNGIDQLAKICNKQGATIYTSDLQSVGDELAALGYGITTQKIGSDAADAAYAIISGEKKPYQIPIVETPTEFKLRISLEAAKKQNLEIDPTLLFLMTNVETV